MGREELEAGANGKEGRSGVGQCGGRKWEGAFLHDKLSSYCSVGLSDVTNTQSEKQASFMSPCRRQLLTSIQ